MNTINTYKTIAICMLSLLLSATAAFAQSTNRSTVHVQNTNNDPRQHITSREQLFQFLFPGSTSMPNAQGTNARSAAAVSTPMRTIGTTEARSAGSLPSDRSSAEAAEEIAEQQTKFQPIKPPTQGNQEDRK